MIIFLENFKNTGPLLQGLLLQLLNLIKFISKSKRAIYMEFDMGKFYYMANIFGKFQVYWT